MKRKRVLLRDIPDDQYRSLLENPFRVLRFLEQTVVEHADGHTYILACVKTTGPKLDVRFYPTQEDFLLDYTSCIMRGRDDYEFVCFRLEEDEEAWGMFAPPPVVGLGVHTKLRPGAADF
jgi:hypothetical protein